MREDDVRNGGVWKVIYREGGSKNGWEVINAVKKRGKTRFVVKSPAMTLMQSGKYNPKCTCFFWNIYSGLIRYQ